MDEDEQLIDNLKIIGYVYGSCFFVLGTILLYIKCRYREKVTSNSEGATTATVVELPTINPTGAPSSETTGAEQVVVTILPAALQGVDASQVEEWQ